MQLVKLLKSLAWACLSLFAITLSTGIAIAIMHSGFSMWMILPIVCAVSIEMLHWSYLLEKNRSHNESEVFI